MLYTSLLLLLASAAQCSAASSSPKVTSLVGPTDVTSPFPAVLACGPSGNPSAVVLYYTSKDGNMRNRKATKNSKGAYTWSPVSNMGGPFQPYTPAAIDYKGRALVVQIGLDQSPKYATFDPAQQCYGSWVTLAGHSQTAPGAVYLTQKDEVLIFVRGLDAAYYFYRGTPDKGFSSYNKLNGQYKDPPQPIVVCDSTGNQYVILVGTGLDNIIYYLKYVNGSWSSYIQTSFKAPDGYASLGLYPSNYDSSLKCYRGATLVATTNSGQALQATYHDLSGWKTFTDFGYQVPLKFRLAEYSNGTCAYSTNTNGQVYVSAYGRSVCGNSY